MYFRFMDDITFVRSGPYGDAWQAEPLTYYHYSVVAILAETVVICEIKLF